MALRTVLLYCCAVAVIVPGIQILAAVTSASTGTDGPPTPRRIWHRPVPPAAVLLVAVMVALAVVQSVVPSLVDHLERVPGGPWWRAVTALLVQSSGWFQVVFNLAALAVVAPIAERAFGAVRMLGVYVVSGVAAQVVSMAGWSPRGAGDSVAVCGLVGALATAYALRGPLHTVRRLALLVPVSGIVLCLIDNNHGVGVVVGCALGAVFTVSGDVALADPSAGS
ncbi:rhomboid family intramembrane serine protease [Streptomyces sp. NPDC102360]|uniref:rhomboid family intramembrane serine protease n=1 Tax=Streptomyces sp. NPDC102360 TaxID=3366160 RepID=UPI003829EE1E